MAQICYFWATCFNNLPETTSATLACRGLSWKKIIACFIYLIIKTQHLGAGKVSLEHSRMMQHFGTEDSSNKQFYSNEKKSPESCIKRAQTLWTTAFQFTSVFQSTALTISYCYAHVHNFLSQIMSSVFLSYPVTKSNEYTRRENMWRWRVYDFLQPHSVYLSTVEFLSICIPSEKGKWINSSFIFIFVLVLLKISLYILTMYIKYTKISLYCCIVSVWYFHNKNRNGMYFRNLMPDLPWWETE